MGMISVLEAADELGVSGRRVHQMLADGRLPGARVGRSWVLDRQAVLQAAQSRVRAGRPWCPSSAWDVLAMASGVEIKGSAVDRFRARQRAEDGIAPLVGKLASRAERHQFYAHPSVLGELLEHPGIVASGVSALGFHNVDLVAIDQAEGYIPRSELASMIDEYELDNAADRPNVQLRVVDDEYWPFEARQRYAPLPIVAVDLLDSADERSRRAGQELLNQL